MKDSFKVLLITPSATPPPSTGEPRELSLQSSSRAHAVHAGLSPALLPLKALGSIKPDNLSHYPSSRSLTATPRAINAMAVLS